MCNDKRLKLHLVDHNRLYNDPQFEDVGILMTVMTERNGGLEDADCAVGNLMIADC